MQPNAPSIKLMKPGGIPYDLPPKRPMSIDGVVRRRTTTTPDLHAPAPRTAPRVVADVMPARRPSTAPQPAAPAEPAPRATRVVTATTTEDTPAIDRPEPIYRRKKRARSHRLAWWAARWTLVLAAAIVGSLLSQALMLGGLAIAVYAMCAWLLPIKSERTFGLALLALVATVLTLSFNGESLIAKNFATYTFLLMAVGVVSLTLETRKKNAQVYRRA